MPGNDHLIKIDLHVHTNRYSPCAESLDPELLHQHMIEANLDGVVITEHDQMWSPVELSNINKNPTNKRIYRGVEISCANGHFIVIGLEDTRGIKAGISILKLFEITRKYNAAVILVHHHLSYSQITEPLNLTMPPDGIDAIEVFSTATNGKHSIEAWEIAVANKWVPVAGSDAHHLKKVGTYYTCFRELPDSEKELANVIKCGECVAATG